MWPKKVAAPGLAGLQVGLNNTKPTKQKPLVSKAGISIAHSLTNRKFSVSHWPEILSLKLEPLRVLCTETQLPGDLPN